jgi:hypothetical protein
MGDMVSLSSFDCETSKGGGLVAAAASSDCLIAAANSGVPADRDAVDNSW